MMGNEARERERERHTHTHTHTHTHRERERERERERFGERGRATQWREITAWVDFDHWSESTTPENFLKASIN